MTEAISAPESPVALTSMSVVAFFAAEYVAVMPDGKLHANGAFFNLLRFPSFPAVQPTLGIAAVLKVPFQATMQEHAIRIGLRDQDGHDLPVSLEARFRSALTVEAQFGDAALVPFGATVTNVEFPAPGTYRLILWFDGAEQADYTIRIAQVPGMPSMWQTPPPAT
jgi:hypothetical protein